MSVKILFTVQIMANLAISNINMTNIFQLAKQDILWQDFY